MKYTIGLLLTVLLLVSCRDDDEVLQPEWLDERIAEILQSSIADYSYILQARYDKQTVFIFDNCCPFCASLPPQVHAIDGTMLGYIGTDIDASDITRRTLYWQTANGQCVFTDL